MDILNRWSISLDELTCLIDNNPSLRGFLFGYVAEHHLFNFFKNNLNIISLGKDADHDRKNKGDLRFSYQNKEFRFESKSLQSSSIKKENDLIKATYQCDASDKRKVDFSDGSSLNTTSLLVGEFDIVAVNLFGALNEWNFAFALNKDLPRSKYKKYTQLQRDNLLATSMPITYPLSWPYVSDPFVLMELILSGKETLPKL